MGMSSFRSGFRALIIVLLLGTYGGSGVFAETRKPKNVQVAVQAKWSGTSVLLEAGYFCFRSPIFFVLFCTCWFGATVMEFQWENVSWRKLGHVDEVLHQWIVNNLKALGEVPYNLAAATLFYHFRICSLMWSNMIIQGSEDNGHWVQCLCLSNVFHLGGGICMFLEWACL